MGFGGGHSENLSSQECIGGTDQDRPETSEPAQRTWDVMVLGESARVMLGQVGSVIFPADRDRTKYKTYPVAESNAVVAWSATQIDDKTKEDKTNNGDDLDGRKPKFAFSKGAGAQKVDDDNDETGDGDPNGIVDLAVPVYKRS